MRLHSLRLQHFRQHTDTAIEFGDGLTGIVGANGAGKSTILEAIAWALYGAPAARGKKDSIRSMRAPARASVKVELEFELAGVRYRVVRGLTNAEVFIDGSVTPAASSISGVAELLRAKLGMSLDEFFNTYFTGQKELSVMAAMGPTERGQFLSKLLGYERLRVAQELARERKRSIVAEATGMSAGMQHETVIRQATVDAKARFDEAHQAVQAVRQRQDVALFVLDELTPKWDAVQVERRALDAAIANYRAVETQLTAHRDNLYRINSELAAVAPERLELEELTRWIRMLAGARAALEAMDGLAKDDGRRQALMERRLTLTNGIVLVDQRCEQLSVAPQFEVDALAEQASLQGERQRIGTAYDEAAAAFAAEGERARLDYEDLSTSLVKLSKQRELLVNDGLGGTCPTCRQALGEHVAVVLASLDAQITEIAHERNVVRTLTLATPPKRMLDLFAERAGLDDQITRITAKLAKIRDGVRELVTLRTLLDEKRTELAALTSAIDAIPAGYSVERHTALKIDVAQLQAHEVRAAKLSGIVEREGQLRADREQATALVSGTEARLAELAGTIAGQEDIEVRFTALRTAYESAVSERSAADVAGATAVARRDSAVTTLNVAAEAFASYEQTADRLAALNRDRRLHEDVDRAFSELRTDLNLQLRPEISVRASELLAELTDGRYSEAELDENYTLVLVEDNKPKSVISGGEEDLANLVLRLVISQMIAERAGQPLSLLILDEVFGSLDEARRQNVVALLRRLHDRFEQVIVITHTDSVRDDLDHTITVIYDEASASAVANQDASAA